MKHIITLIFCMLLVLPMVGQQEIILTKYTFNQMFFNPAYAGSNGKDQGSASLQYRNQWLGVEGAPQTVLAGAEYSFFDNSLGLGMTMAQEKIGINSNSNLHFNSAYRIRLGEGHLSGGIRAGITHISSDFSNLSIRDEGDIYAGGSEQITLFNVGAGILFHQEAMKIGFSLPTLVSIGEGSIDRVRHFYSHMEVKIGDDYSTIKWQPNLLVKYEKSVPLQLTMGVQAWLNDQIAPGLHYRVGESVALSFELILKEKLHLTAAFDFAVNDLHDYTTGSLEVMMSYRLGDGDVRN